MRQTLKFSRIADAVSTLSEGVDLWRAPWKKFGFDFCGVYIIAPRNLWPVKVGISEDVKRRLHGLQCSHWNEMIVARYWVCEDRAAAFRVEQKTHELLQESGQHLLGEWFDSRVEHAAELVEFAAAALDVELAAELPRAEKFDELRDYLERLNLLFQQRQTEVGMASHFAHDGRVAPKTVLHAERTYRRRTTVKSTEPPPPYDSAALQDALGRY